MSDKERVLAKYPEAFKCRDEWFWKPIHIVIAPPGKLLVTIGKGWSIDGAYADAASRLKDNTEEGKK